jgi:serine/threonine protein kinase
MKLTLQTLLNNRYQVTSYLSQGGFGYTYLAIDNLFNEKVCVKELYISGRSTRGAGQEVVSENSKDFSFEYFADRFWDEARQLASFNHPNIVKVKDFFKANGTIYMVMEFIEGETLQARKKKGGLEDEKSLHHVMSQLLDAVEEVHRHGILHRDIKPENILITKEDKVVLIDFGSARDFEDGKTVAHTTLLTPGYAPIEQYSNRAKRGTYTDIYALGATMYFLLTGEKPLAATDRHLESLMPPHKINSSVSSQLSSAVMMAMEMKPEDRFQHVGELREVLKLLDLNREKSFGTIEKEQSKTKITEKVSDATKDLSHQKNKRNRTVFLLLIPAFLLLPVSYFIFFYKSQNYCDCMNSLNQKLEAMDKNDYGKLLANYNEGFSTCSKLKKERDNCKIEIALKEKKQFYEKSRIDEAAALYFDKKYEEAFAIFNSDAFKENSSAKYYLARMYKGGDFVKKDLELAFKLGKESADMGDAFGLNFTGLNYDYGTGIEIDKKKAAEYYSKAIEVGCGRAYHNLGHLYHKGILFPKDYKRAQELYFKALENKDRYFYNDAKGMTENNIALIYLNGGYGLTVNYEKAREYYQSAINFGNIKALSGLGWLYQKGLGVPVNEAESFRLYAKAAEQNDDEGQYQLGNMYYYGIACKKDLRIAFSYFKKSAEQNLVKSISMLGYMYENGKGLDAINLKEAENCYRKAAGLGDEWAKEQLTRF